MTLVNRVSLFFLAALAACLGIDSALSFVLIRDHLYRQFDQQLASSLNALVAAVEVEVDAVKWQPLEHTIAFGDDRAEDDVRWIITDEHGDIRDRSDNLNNNSQQDAALLALARTDSAEQQSIAEAQRWRLLQKRLTAPQPKSDSELEADESAQMTLTVARSTDPLHANLWKLGWLVCVLPCALWVLAALAGRAYCRRALKPLRMMAARTKAMSVPPVTFQHRLLIAPHRDELSDLAGAFNDLLGQLQQAFEKQQRFAGEAAHQLRTPLTILRGEIDVALRRPRNDEEYRRVLRTLGDQTHELQQIVEILLQLARLEREDARFDQERVDLTNWLPSQLSRWSDHPRAVDLRVHAENDLWVTTSPALLAQAIHNLLDNAVKYSPPGSPVTLAAARQAGSVILTVTDEGVGISSDERSAIFDPFYRGSFARRRGIVGTGLGLPLVARIATVLGGSATCDGRPGQGSRFTLSLPLSDDLDRPPATTQEDHLISKT